MIFSIIIFIATLAFLIISHEFGHFLTAKKFGVKVLEFGFGIPPKIFGKKIGGTLVSLNWLPFGGFVRLYGEDETDKRILKDKKSFASHKVWQRIIIICAGATVNFLIAVIIFWIVLVAQGFKEQLPLLVSHNFIGVNQTTQTNIMVGELSPTSPALGKIAAGDRIVKFNGVVLADANQLIALTKQQLGKEIKLVVENPDNVSREVSLVPRVSPPKGEGSLGMELGTFKTVNLAYETTPQKLAAGFAHSYNLASYSIVLLGHFISQSFATQNFGPVSQTLSGPVAISGIASDILQSKSPLIPYLNFVALLSLNLAILNILPFPALDGGRLFFLLIEGLFRKKVKAEIESFVHTIGFAILMALFIVVTFSDIRKLFF